MLKRYTLYLLRWQLSTPILAFCLVFFNFGVTWNTILANLIGGLIFFWADRYIFTAKNGLAEWQIAQSIVCESCNAAAVRGYRYQTPLKYKQQRTASDFLCEQCSHQEATNLLNAGDNPYATK